MFICKHPLPTDWEQRLQESLMKRDYKKRPSRIYVCSPCRERTWQEIWRNMMAARFYMYLIWQQTGYIARAPHGYMAMLFDDCDQRERMDALGAGTTLLRHSDALYVCGDRISTGMRHEIIYAGRCKKPIIVFNKKIFKEVGECLTGVYGAKKRLTLVSEEQFHLLELGSKELFGEVSEDA